MVRVWSTETMVGTRKDTDSSSASTSTVADDADHLRAALPTAAPMLTRTTSAPTKAFFEPAMAAHLRRQQSARVLPRLDRRSSPTAVPFVLVTDPGPDPDDIKALLVAAMLHLHARIDLRAVICNGGGQPRERAALARCVLDHLGAAGVPVGVGSHGVPSTPQAHEFAIANYSAVKPSRLLEGRQLLIRVLQHARPKSLRVVLISSLADFADAVATHPALVLAKVHTVAVQGGLERDPSSPSGWRADSSVNNLFDLAAADAVYAFCFAHNIRLTVVSRHAVPLLPMQLARSFAERTDCPVMRYLADAQFLGLVGLWQKLCAGLLPPRCTKQVRSGLASVARGRGARSEGARFAVRLTRRRQRAGCPAAFTCALTSVPWAWGSE
jgi:hypothetical protein